MFIDSMPQMSVGSAFVMAGLIVVALALCLGIVLFAARRPYFKHPKPTRMQGKRPVTGGVHEGDPGSVSPPRDKPVQPQPPARQQAGRAEN